MTDRPEPITGLRLPGETNNSVLACNDFIRMGPGRSLVRLLEKYKSIQESTAPTKKKHTLEAWSSRYSWYDRAAEYDKNLEDEKNARARQIMESGLALDYERVLELKAMADFLKMQIFQLQGQIQPEPAPTQPTQSGQEQPPAQDGHPYPYVWLRDRKVIGKGDKQMTIDTIRFNEAIISQFRGLLDDLAKETGGRVSKHEVTGEDGGPIEIGGEQHDRAISTLATALGALLSGESTGGEGSLGSTE